MSGTYSYSPVRNLVAEALGLPTVAQQPGAPASLVQQILAAEAQQATSGGAPPAPAAPEPQQPSGGGGIAGDLAQYGGYANRLRQLYNLGSRAYDTYNTAGLAEAANIAAATAIPAAATAIFSKGAQTLAKPGGETGAAVGAGAGALAGTAIFPGIGTALGALIGGTIGGQIGPNPSVGANLSALGTFDERGNLTMGGYGADNGPNREMAREFGENFMQTLPQLAAQRGLEFNPAAAGQGITAGIYMGGPRLGRAGGAFYVPSTNAGSPENYARFFQDPEQYANFVLADLTARNIFRPAGSEDTNIYGVAGPQGGGQGLFRKTDRPVTYEDFLTRGMAGRSAWQAEQQRNQEEAAAAAQRQAFEQRASDWQQRTGAELMTGAPEGEQAIPFTYRLPDGSIVTLDPNQQNFAQGGQVIELQGGGKIAVGPGGGLDDLIPTSINGRRAAALSDGEFVIPADVVSMLGDGSSNAGSRRLYDIVRQIRQAKTGTSEQAGPLPVGEILKRAMS